MSSTRGRGLNVLQGGATAVKGGGMAIDAGASSRMGGAGVQVRPAYQSAAGQIQPLPPVQGQVGALFDLSSVISWRLLIIAAAAAYIWGFHVTLGRVRVGVGPA